MPAALRGWTRNSVGESGERGVEDVGRRACKEG